MIARAPLGDFLNRNPFADGWTDGLFYREKMRAIHRVAPCDLPDGARILEVGGGRSGLATMLYPNAHVTTVDIDASLAGGFLSSPTSQFICADAAHLPLADASFDLVTMFDVLEHIPEDKRAADEAWRVTRPGGFVLVSTPAADWRYPHHRFMQRWCPPETELMEEWGHVRRGYSVPDLVQIFGRPADRLATFINPVTAFFHDVAFSRLGRRRRRLLYATAALPVALAYSLHGNDTKGTETALAWQR